MVIYLLSVVQKHALAYNEGSSNIIQKWNVIIHASCIVCGDV